MKKALILLMLALMLSGPASSGVRKGLIVGIGDYAGQPDLRSPANDIKAISDLLIGWYGFESRNIVVLRDRAASRKNIEREIRRLADTSKDDVVVVYYSGHGTMSYAGGLIEEALVPADGDPARPNTLITTKQLRRWLQDIPAGQVDVILDCCYSGGFVKDPTAQTELKCVFPQSIPADAVEVMDKTLVVSRPGHVVISASQTGRDVPDTEFPLVDGSRLRISALAFCLYRQAFSEPDVPHTEMVAGIREMMKSWKVKQDPGVGGVIGQRRLFGGAKLGIKPRTAPVCAQSGDDLEMIGGSILDIVRGTSIKCLDARGKAVKSARVSGSDWRRSRLKVSGLKSKIIAVKL